MATSLTASMPEAKTRLSSLVEMLESGDVDEVLIARDGTPVARLVPLVRPAVRLGVARGRFTVPASIDGSNDEIRRMFEEDTDAPAS